MMNFAKIYMAAALVAAVILAPQSLSRKEIPAAFSAAIFWPIMLGMTATGAVQ